MPRRVDSVEPCCNMTADDSRGLRHLKVREGQGMCWFQLQTYKHIPERKAFQISNFTQARPGRRSVNITTFSTCFCTTSPSLIPLSQQSAPGLDFLELSKQPQPTEQTTIRLPTTSTTKTPISPLPRAAKPVHYRLCSDSSLPITSHAKVTKTVVRRGYLLAARGNDSIIWAKQLAG